MDTPPPPDLDELRRRHETALELSALAVERNFAVYRDLRRNAVLVAYGTLDIGAYYKTVEEMVGCLETLCRTGAGTVFVFYRQALDPKSEGHIRTFRPLCCDLLATLEALDRWRRAKRRIRCVK